MSPRRSVSKGRDEKRTVSVYVNEDTINQLDRYAQQHNTSRSGAVELLLREVRSLRHRLNAQLRVKRNADRGGLGFKAEAKEDFERLLKETEYED